ncbi:MAG: hypothetical protein V2A54_15380 [Bacteroidota bacterium]
MINEKKFFLTAFFILVITVGCSKFPELGKGYKFIYNSFDDIGIVNKNDIFVIHGGVIEYGCNDKFIIASERPRDSVPECNFQNGENMGDCNRAYNESDFFQYWIICKDNDSVWGPFKKDEFLIKRKEKGVPVYLHLVPVQN